ncbi:MAG TPA: cytochrome c3 family protein [Candidatus Polarisedimenticolaceae bacterium]|nr:cytochrome c3 family protein [Candidatus Polarisedimenticolaceae bacterium]
MAQIFPKSTLRIPLFLALGGPLLGGLAVGGVWYYGSPSYTDVGYRPTQPVPYSHRLHVGQLGLDCRYCHASVEVSTVANIPPTKVCMNCHRTVKRDSPLLEPIRQSAQSGRPMRWIRVHNLPDYAYFDHAGHVRAGVGCVSCHGRIDKMEVVQQAQPLSMGWCLACHRDPGPALRPREEVTNMEWVPPSDQAAFARQAIADKHLEPPTDCSGCHR